MKLKLLLMLSFISAFALAQNLPAGKAWKIIVAQNGTGDYKTVQSALDAIPSNSNKPVTIYIKKGIYKEVVTVDATKSFITLIGEDANNTILSYNNHAGTKLQNGDTLNTWTSASTFIYGNDLHAENL